jgi:hypothetical protein
MTTTPPQNNKRKRTPDRYVLSSEILINGRIIITKITYQ